MEYYRDIANQNQKIKHESTIENETKMAILIRKNEKLLKEKQELSLEIACMKQEIEQKTNKQIKLENDVF